MNTSTEDTIAAIATAPGRSALGIVRISGKECCSLLPEIFRPRKQGEIPTGRPILGKVILGGGQFLDQALLTLYRAPHSYTREDVAEICCHGNPLILEKVLTRAVSIGARLAMPGEFTYRAFLNGRLDLVQAEAVQDLIQADSIHQVEMALNQLDGRLSKSLEALRREMLELVALLEGNIDFSEEQHYEFTNPKDATLRTTKLADHIRQLLGTFERGRMIRDGFNVALVGRPNVGKSSIFNLLLGEDRAIVTPVPGTTRDFLRERLRMGNYLINLLDTAGIRAGTEDVEREGIRRSRKVVEKADLLIFVLDGSVPIHQADQDLWAEICSRDVIFIANKADLPSFQRHTLGGFDSHAISASTGTGIEDLLDLIRKRVEERVRYRNEDSMISSLRHRNLLHSAMNSLEKGKAGLKSGITEEFVLVDFRDALRAIGEITGEVTVDEMYQHIFSNFCIGK